MRVSIRLILSGFLFFSFPIAQGRAQGSEFYRNLLHPLALANLDSLSIVPLRYANGHGTPSETDSTGAHILASDTGAGVITHIWSAIGEQDSGTLMRLWIDGVLIREGTAAHFYLGDTGLFLRSLDSAASGGYDCDVQLPYLHSFRLTYTSPQGNIWFAVEWRPLPGNSLAISTANPDSTLLRTESEAATVADTRSWDIDKTQSNDTTIVLRPESSTVLWSLTGPSVITALRFKPNDWNIPLDSLWLQIFWNGSDSAAVDAPLSDFFGQGAGFVPINSIAITSSRDSGFECRFPMPFEHGARIVLVNVSSAPMPVSMGVDTYDTSLTWSTTGYFHAYFSETNPTRYGVFHPVLHWKGPGRFVGINLAIPNNQYPCALEGDAITEIDSMPLLSFDYTGTEDYFGGGFYFADGPFSHPFSGCTQKWYGFYRFHILNAVDFNHSIDFNFQHGNNNDVSCDYRSVAYFYAPWSQCWVRCDTVFSGQLCTLYGSAYSPHQSLNIQIGTESVATISADLNGSVQVSIMVPADILPGVYSISVGGARGCTLYVLARPTLKILSDSANLSVSPDDSISVVGWGFDPHSSPSFMLGGFPLTVRFLAIDSLGRLRAKLMVPALSAGQYALDALVGTDTWTAEEPVVIASRIWIEAENLKIDTSAEGPIAPENLCPWWNARWSRQEVLDFLPDSAHAFFVAEFNMVRGGAYSLIVHGTTGVGFGNYQLIVDDSDSGILNGNSAGYPPIPAIMDTLDVQLDSGRHRMRLNYLGSTATNGELWLDALEFEPTFAAVTVPQGGTSDEQVIQDQLSETVCVIFHDSLPKNADLELYDVAGRLMDITPDFTQQIASFSTRLLPNGVYFLIIRHNLHKLLIVR